MGILVILIEVTQAIRGYLQKGSKLKPKNNKRAKVNTPHLSPISNWWSGSNGQEERSEAKVESKVQPSSGSFSSRGLAEVSREDGMQSDQPMPSQSLARSRKSAPSEEKQEQIILKDTILKVQKTIE